MFTILPIVEWEHKGRNAKASRKWECRPTQEVIAEKNGIWNSRSKKIQSFEFLYIHNLL